MVQASDAVWLPVLPSMKGFGPALAKGAGSEADKTGKSVGKRFGTAMMVGVAGVAAAVGTAGVALYKVGEIFDDVTDTIRVGSGASGEALDGLVTNAKNIGRTVPAEFDKIGSVVADVSTRLGLTGPVMEKVASQYLEAGRILGEDIDVGKTSAAFNAFKIEGEDVAGAMDHLFQVSQATGIGMNDLASQVSMNAPAVQALGFGFEEAAVMVGSFDKAGLNSSQMMSGMSRSLVNLAKDGEEPAAAFERTVNEIEGFIEKGDEAAAIDLAGKVFGTRGASQFVGAVKAGALNLDDMTKAAGQTGDTILGLGEETMDFEESWQMFKNNVLVWLEPMGARVFGALGGFMQELTGGVSAFSAAWSDAGNDITSSGLAGFMERMGLALRGVWDILSAGDFSGKLRGAFGWEEDHPMVGFLFNVRDLFLEVTGGVEAFTAAWTYNDGEITSSGFPGVMERLGYWARQTFDYLKDTAIPAMGDLATFMWENKEVIGIVAGVITALLLPALVRKGITATVSAAKSVLAWAAERTAAATTAASYVVQSYKIIGTWVANSIAAMKSGVQTVAVWAMYKAEAIKGAAVQAAQSARVVGSWVLMRVQAAGNAVRMAASWAVGIIVPAASATAAMAVQAGRVVARWVFMGAQSLLQAARMAAAWLIAMGPIGWAIAAIVGIAAIVIANWDKIKKFTIDAWNAISGKVKEVWQNNIKPIFQALGDFIESHVKPAFKRGVDAIKGIWDGIRAIAAKPINFVIDTVYNNGLRKAFNFVAGLIPGVDKLGPMATIPGYAKGGRMVDGMKLVGEEGPELIDTRPGYVYTASETKRMLNAGGMTDDQLSVAAGTRPSEALLPMGGWWDNVVTGAKDAFSAGTKWALGGLADLAGKALNPIKDALAEAIPGGGFGAVARGLATKAIDSTLSFLRGKDDKHISQGSGALTFNGPLGRTTRPHGPITSHFGRRWGGRHDGTDWGGGGAIRAFWDGIVRKVGWNAAPGRTGIGTIIDHAQGLSSYYGHQAPGSPRVKRGDIVKSGQVIGQRGLTGNTTGLHLHGETWKNGQPRNPLSYLYDDGGVVHPGLTTVDNRSRKPEALLSSQQWSDIHQLAKNGAGAAVPGRMTVRIGEKEFEGYVESIGDARLEQHVDGLRQVSRQMAGR
ncbi:peptidoglycan DD-metalloendopeptidase family protein [Citricoccus sp. NPDC055426]|uniref:peptidoglycan DD-metalloendopeptidase family protein n=1 Tax=Citricoccus sp. NPDC055426 TaxID=3155536 RepID=UPI00341CBD2D